MERLILSLLEEVEVPEINKEYFSTEEFIYTLSKSIYNEITTNDLEILDKLCKKIDVSGEVFIYYVWDLSSKKSNKKIKDNYMFLLASLLLMYSSSLNDYKFLNSALKILNFPCLNKKSIKYLQIKDQALEILNGI